MGLGLGLGSGGLGLGSGLGSGLGLGLGGTNHLFGMGLIHLLKRPHHLIYVLRFFLFGV